MSRLWQILRGNAGTDARLVLRRGYDPLTRDRHPLMEEIRVTLCRTQRGNGTGVAEVLVQM